MVPNEVHFKTSRKSDLLDLTVMLIYMIDSDVLNEVRFFEDGRQRLDNSKTIVQDLDLVRLCRIEYSRAHLLLPFVEEVMSYNYLEMPNYEKLQFLLEKILLDYEVIPKQNINPIREQLKSSNRNIRARSTLQINFDFENMSDSSMDSDEFENLDEFADKKENVLRPEIAEPVNQN